MTDLELFEQYLEADVKDTDDKVLAIAEMAERLEELKQHVIKAWNDDDYQEIATNLGIALNYCIQAYSSMTFKNVDTIKQEMAETFKAKNHDYGNSVFDVASDFEPYGSLTFLIRISDKINRIKSLSKKKVAKVQESLEDTFIDCANYIVLYKVYIHKKMNF